MKYAQIIENDVVNGEGFCVSFWVQGCPHRCPGCFNKETWDFNGGIEYSSDIKWDIIKLISANGIQRNFSILGGEPLAPQNLPMSAEIIDAVRHAYPNIKIFLWTGYIFEDLIREESKLVQQILNDVDVIIDGPFIEEKKDLSLLLRGSTNQHIRIKMDNKWTIRE